MKFSARTHRVVQCNDKKLLKMCDTFSSSGANTC